MNLLQHIERWLADHTQRFNVLPSVTVPSAAVTDDDTEAWGDLRYMQELLDDIEHACKGQGLRLVDRGLVEFDIDVYLPPWPVDLAAIQLADWRGLRRLAA